MEFSLIYVYVVSLAFKRIVTLGISAFKAEIFYNSRKIIKERVRSYRKSGLDL